MDKKLPNDTGVVLATYGESEFRRDIMDRFPKLRSFIESDPLSVHLDMGSLAGIVRDEIQSNSTETSRAICDFLAEVLRKPRLDSEIPNAVAISFVAPSELSENESGHALLNAMPASVRQILIEQEKRYASA